MRSIKYLFLALAAMLVSMALAPVTAPSRPGLYSPISKTVMSIDVTANTVTLKWYRSAPSPLESITDYDVEVAESSSVNPDGSFVAANVVYSGNEPAPVPVTNIVQHIVPANTFDYGKTYYWHVMAHDTSPTTPNSLWSGTGVFRVGIEPPTITVFGAADLLSLRPTFKWTPGTTPGVPNATSYTLQISMDSGFSTIYRTATILPTALPANEYTPTTVMTANTTFYWRIRANNSAFGASAWDTSVSFITANPPSIPILVSPNNTVEPVDGLTLKWKPSTLFGGNTFGTYQIQIFDDKDLNNVAPILDVDDTAEPTLGNQGSLTPLPSYLVVPPLNPTTIYYWRMRAINDLNGQYSEWSTVWTFRTGIVGAIDATKMDPSETLGNAPGLEGPAGAVTKPIDASSAAPHTYDASYTGITRDNINLLSLRPTFKWDPGTLNAQTVTLQIASKAAGGCNVVDPNASTFTSPIINTILPYTQKEYVANLEKYPNYILCWRIRGNHTLYGSSAWSDVQIFLTANPPTTPILVGPVDAMLTNDNSPKFVWKKVSLPSGVDFGKYEIEISHTKDFKGYIYPNTVPPYAATPLVYPLDLPPLPTDDVTAATLPVNPPTPALPLYATNFRLYPQIAVAHHTNPGVLADYGMPNTVDEPWFQMHEDSDIVVPPTFGQLYGGRTYYWRVRSYNSDGEYSSWSTPLSIKITFDRPENLTVDIPPVLPDVADLRPLFRWDPVIKASSGLDVKTYRILISRYSTFRSGILLSTNVAGTQYRPTIDLPANTTLYAKVFAIDPSGTYGYGASLASEPISFTTTWPPKKPTLFQPANSSLVTTLTPTFRWKVPYDVITLGADPFDHYDIQIAQDPNFVLGTVFTDTLGAPGDNPLDIAVTTYPLAPADALDPLKQYYWRVRTCNTTPSCSTWSIAFAFKTSVEMPTNLLMDTAAPYCVLRPNFSWDPVAGASTYTLFVSRYASCTGTGIIVSSPTYTLSANLAPSTTYYWCVRANAGGFGPGPRSSPIETFTTP